MVGNLFSRTRVSQEKGRNGLPRRPFIGDQAAINEGYQDYLDEQKDTGGADGVHVNLPRETSLGKGPEISPTKSERIESSPEFYAVQDKTGRIKFNAASINALVSTYDEVTGPSALTPVELHPDLKDLLEISYKIKNGEYKSIDQLSEDIVLCANLSENPEDFKSSFDQVAKHLGIKDDSKKKLYDLSVYNQRKLHNGLTKYQTEDHTPVKVSVDEVEQGVGYTDPSGFGDGPAGEDFATPESGVSAPLSIDEIAILEAGIERIEQQIANNPADEELKLIHKTLTEAKNNGWDKLSNYELEEIRQQLPSISNTGVSESQQRANEMQADSARKLEDLRTGGKAMETTTPAVDTPIAGDVRADTPGRVEKAELNKKAESTKPQKEDKIEQKISEEDIARLEEELNKFKNIQRKSALNDNQLSTFIALAGLKEKGWGDITYGDLPVNLLKITGYKEEEAGMPSEEQMKILNGDLDKHLEGLKRARGASDAAVSRAAEAAIGKAEAETNLATAEIVAAVPALSSVGENTEMKALDRLGVLGIPPGEALNMAEALEALRYKDPKEVLRLTYTGPAIDEEISVPKFLKTKTPEKKNGFVKKFAELLTPAKNKVGAFVGGFKNWWGNKIWERKRANSKLETASDIVNAVTTSALILLALLGGKTEKVEGNEAPKTAITNSANPQTFDNAPNQYPPVFEGQTIYPEVPNINVPDVDAPIFDRPSSKEKEDVLSALGYTKITEEMKQECQQGKYSIMIDCIKATVGAQPEKTRKELTEIIFKAAQARAVAEKVTWSKLTPKEKDAYVDAILGGDKATSPSAKIAKELGLNITSISFTGLDNLKKGGISVAMPKNPKYVPAETVIKYVRELK